MPVSADLLKHIARVAVKYGGNIAGGGIAGNLIIDVWDGWEKSKKTEAERKAELEALAQEPAAKLKATVDKVVREVATNQPPEIRETLTLYLQQVPTMIRRSLKRPSDVRGLSVPTHLRLARADDLRAMLPGQLPRFRPGQRPLAGVDLELQELLGVGGFGEVWKAKNPLLVNAQPVALKFCLDPSAAALLRHEAAMLDRVMKLGKEPGIIRLQHTYLSATPPCLEYEYVAGGDLAGLIQEWQQAGAATPGKSARLLQRLARIVGAAHQQGVVHRDLKPANILLQPQDGKLYPKVADFGIGGIAVNRAMQATRAGGADPLQITAVRGAYTPLYASPQQMRGDPPDPRDDVYSLGVIWFQVLTGDLTAGAPTGRAWQKPLTEAGMTPPLLALLEACIEQQPHHRPASALQLAERLTAALGSTSATDEAAALAVTAPVSRPGKSKRPRWLPLAAGGAAALLLAILAFVFWPKRPAAAPAAPVAPEPVAPVPVAQPTAKEAAKPTAEGNNDKTKPAPKPVTAKESKSKAQSKAPPRVGEIRQFTGHTEKVIAVAFSPKGERIATGAFDHTVRLWDVASGQELKRVSTPDVLSIAFAPDGRHVLAGTVGSGGVLCDMESGEVVNNYPTGDGWCMSVALSGDGKRALVGGAEPVALFDVDSAKLLRTFKPANLATAFTLSRDGKRALCGSAYGRELQLFDVDSGKEVRSWLAHDAFIQAVALSPTASYALSGGNDKTVRYWDLTSFKQLQQLEGHESAVFSVAFSPDGRRALSGDISGVVRLWKLQTSKKMHKFEGHTNNVRSVAISPDGRLAVSASNDKTVRLWSLPEPDW